MQSLADLMLEIIGGRRKEAAQVAGRSEQLIRQVESGTTTPSEEVVVRIVQAFAAERLPEAILALAREKFEATTLPVEMRAAVSEAFSTLAAPVVSTHGAVSPRERTFRTFPDAFYPLAIVTGDKREDRATNVNVGDLGVYSATPADLRWIHRLGLREDTMLHIDKNFVLLGEDDLIEEFGETNLLVVGSPAANHLARRINRRAPFRFNYGSEEGDFLDDFIASARNMSPNLMAALRDEKGNQLRGKMRYLFTGGIVDPTFPDEYVAAVHQRTVLTEQLDFGVLSFAAQPFYEAKCQREGRHPPAAVCPSAQPVRGERPAGRRRPVLAAQAISARRNARSRTGSARVCSG